MVEWNMEVHGGKQTAQWRNSARHARHAHFADAGGGSGTRAHDRKRDRALFGECAGSRTGVAVSRTPSAGRSGVGEFLLGPEREQSQGKILQTHGLRQKAIDRADGALAL